ncbi:MAG: aconitate hydratase, partial [Geobacteraceae bacterium]|nr:aconitate hydratase [Geobacteraceae bacterium]
VVAGKEYGSGSSRDWAAKGPLLLGVRVVIAESFERIHRSNLIGMGILPLQFMEGENRKTLGLDGSETIELKITAAEFKPGMAVTAKISRPDGVLATIALKNRIDTANEVAYFKAGGILQHVLAGYLPR